MAKNKNKKRKVSQTPNKKPQKKVDKKKKKQVEKAPAIVKEEYSDDSLSEPELESEKIQKLIEPYNKDQLIEFICDAAVKDSTILQSIRSIADRDISHRKIFVHGLGWDTTRETLISAFKSYGEIEDLNVVMDRATGKAKGYGFVIFKTRAAANKALKQPQKKINNRVTQCQLASIGPAPAVQNYDTTGRKIYVSNVHSDADAEKLRTFFAKFGEIETGPMGFDSSTGKSRGFALFVYKTQEGAKKVLEEPYKMFEGHQLHCQKASENKHKPAIAVQQPVQTPVLAAVAASQNLALFSQHPTLNPLYSGLLGNPNAGFVAGSFNPMMAGALNPIAIPSTQVAGSSFGNAMGIGGYGAPYGLGTFGGNPSLLGPYGSSATALQGLQSYQSSNMQPSSGAFPGYLS
ncbi:UBP1-associated protein 2B-like [Telopea speciosissima]|uniref:UBP1-associated protein 2B-like n=1 Tax=Telopea speciosissima TaxID=54955 RepID=UPI001CC5E76E|nr:UBP1-associated protein 2B-like [Telopea speciosissima]XP_043696867.1 UBP1-associated protein 2B-like [Telopea speciosissima]XP_043696873.1 UBP1-associated protein 2B-like [Telopea speciosissima]